MSKPATRRVFFPAVWIVAVTVVAAATLIAVGPAKSGLRRSNPASATAMSQLQSVTPAEHARINATYAALPLAFEANQGQVDPQVKYLARGNGYKLYLASSEAIFTVHKQGGDSEVRRMTMDRTSAESKVKSMLRRRAQQNSKGAVAAVHMHMLGANPEARLAAEDPQSAKVNYFIGRDPSKWHSDIPLFGQVSYRNLYPGIDLAFHGSGKQLEFDYPVSPGADRKSNRFRISGCPTDEHERYRRSVLTTVAARSRFTGRLRIRRKMACGRMWRPVTWCATMK